jgi:hypothetical protein
MLWTFVTRVVVKVGMYFNDEQFRNMLVVSANDVLLVSAGARRRDAQPAKRLLVVLAFPMLPMSGIYSRLEQFWNTEDMLVQCE